MLQRIQVVILHSVTSCICACYQSDTGNRKLLEHLTALPYHKTGVRTSKSCHHRSKTLHDSVAGSDRMQAMLYLELSILASCEDAPTAHAGIYVNACRSQRRHTYAVLLYIAFTAAGAALLSAQLLLTAEMACNACVKCTV